MADRHPAPAAVEVDDRGFFTALDGVFGMVQGLEVQILREIVELLRAGSRALQDLLVDHAGYPERMSALFDLYETIRGLVFLIVRVPDPHRSVDQVQGQRPSRSAL
jgi:hypothetical protein